MVAAAGPGYHCDGAGLYLLVAAEGTASWVFRYRLNGRKREMGLGSAAVFSLAEARERAREARKLLADGLDPIERRRAVRGRTPRLWGEAKEAFITTHAPAWRGPAQEAQWRQSLRDYGPPDDLPLPALDTQEVLKRLRPLWKPTAEGGRMETATRLRGRIERIWDAEKVAGHVAGENPARWKGHLEHLLPPARKVQKVKHHPSMPYAKAPTLMTRLRALEGLSAIALRFTILTAVRTNETTGAPWEEFDLKHKLWTIPEERMKSGQEHVVPLSAEALELLGALPRDRPPFALSNNAMLKLLQDDLGHKPYTVHGFRSTFDVWASETGDWPEHVIDAALAHTISDEVKAAYRRTTLLAKRRELMDAWAAYLARPKR